MIHWCFWQFGNLWIFQQIFQAVSLLPICWALLSPIGRAFRIGWENHHRKAIFGYTLATGNWFCHCSRCIKPSSQNAGPECRVSKGLSKSPAGPWWLKISVFGQIIVSPVGIHVMSLDWFFRENRSRKPIDFPIKKSGPKPPVWSEVHCDNLMQDISGQKFSWRCCWCWNMKRLLFFGGWVKTYCYHMAVCQNLVPLVNIKIAGKWMFIPLKLVLIGIDPYPYLGEYKTL